MTRTWLGGWPRGALRGRTLLLRFHLRLHCHGESLTSASEVGAGAGRSEVPLEESALGELRPATFRQAEERLPTPELRERLAEHFQPMSRQAKSYMLTKIGEEGKVAPASSYLLNVNRDSHHCLLWICRHFSRSVRLPGMPRHARIS